jgi:DnaJ family protein B protein 13
MIRNYYESLRVTRAAPTEEIAESYRKLALRYHPKTTKEPQEVAGQVFSELAEAYEVLSDPVKRAYFDKYGVEKLKEGFYEEGKLRGGYRFASNPHAIFDQFFKDQEVLGSVLDLKLNTEGSLFGHAFGGLDNKEAFVCEPLVVKVPCKLEELYRGATKTVKYERKVGLAVCRC